jgi:hypothetical protein
MCSLPVAGYIQAARRLLRERLRLPQETPVRFVIIDRKMWKRRVSNMAEFV